MLTREEHLHQEILHQERLNAPVKSVTLSESDVCLLERLVKWLRLPDQTPLDANAIKSLIEELADRNSTTVS